MREREIRSSGRGRIDARLQNSEATQAGMMGIHRGMRGEVIGGYTAEGQGLGTKRRGRELRQQPVYPMASDRSLDNLTVGNTSPTPAANGNLLKQRQALYKSMEKAGHEGLTPDMREQARRLGVSDESFNRVAEKMRTNAVYTPGKTNAPAAAAPVSAAPTTSSRVEMSGPPLPGDMKSPTISSLTGLPMGFKAGDQLPDRPWVTPAMRQAAQESTARRDAASQAAGAPSAGVQRARESIAKYGAIGAAERYLANSAAEKANAPAPAASRAVAIAPAVPAAPAQPAVPVVATPTPSPMAAAALPAAPGGNDFKNSWRQPSMPKGPVSVTAPAITPFPVAKQDFTVPKPTEIQSIGDGIPNATAPPMAAGPAPVQPKNPPFAPLGEGNTFKDLTPAAVTTPVRNANPGVGAQFISSRPVEELANEAKAKRQAQIAKDVNTKVIKTDLGDMTAAQYTQAKQKQGEAAMKQRVPTPEILRGTAAGDILKKVTTF